MAFRKFDPGKIRQNPFHPPTRDADMNTSSFLEALDPSLTFNLTSTGEESGQTKLRPVTDLPPVLRPIFSQFPYFNLVQSETFDLTFGSDLDLVVSAPTGSGI